MNARAQFVRFIAVGVLNTGVGLACIWGCLYFFGMGAASANAVGYACGLAFSFALNRRWTFQDRLADGALPRWLALAAFAYGVNLLVVLTLVRSGLVNAFMAQPLGIAPYTLLMFFGARTFVFREAPRQALP